MLRVTIDDHQISIPSRSSDTGKFRTGSSSGRGPTLAGLFSVIRRLHSNPCHIGRLLCPAFPSPKVAGFPNARTQDYIEGKGRKYDR